MALLSRGLEWSLLAVIDLEQNTAYSLIAQQTPSGLSQSSASKDTLNRLDWYLEQMKQHRDQLPPDIRYLVNDGFYSQKKWIDGTRALGLHVIGKLRHDSRLKYFYKGTQKPRGRNRKYAGAVDYFQIDSPAENAEGFEFVSTTDEGIDLYRAWVYSEAFQRPIQVVYLLKVSATTSSDILLYCTDEHLSAMNVYRYYKARFQLEFIFRDGKQYLSLTHCQARDSQKLNFHVNSVLLTLNVLKVHWLNEQSQNDSKQSFSVANYKRRLFNEHLLSRFISMLGLEQSLDKSQDAYLQCLELGLIF